MYEKLESRVLELEEYLDRFIVSSNLGYDEDFHKVITKKYTDLIKDIRSEKHLSDDEKRVLIGLIEASMKFASMDI